METIDTLIIGAGPAGLTTAYNLAKAGHDVLVIEQDKHYVGGISRTVSYKRFLFDIVLIGRTERTWPDNWIYIHDPRVTGRPGAKLPLVVARDGPGHNLDMPRA